MTSSRGSQKGSMRQDAHEAQPRAGIDIPFGPPPVEYFYGCGACGEEMWVNKAIIDVAVGVAKFHGEYRGGMPGMGCPGCNGEAMEYVGQEQ
jgi:hypothetical protein